MEDRLREKINRTYYRIKDRCYNPKNVKYKLYGQRGIKVCDEWLNDKNEFVKWALSSGIKQDLSIDRMDVNGDYSPNNCRWADSFTQARNKRRSIYLEHNNITKTLKEWCKDYNLPYETIKNRINQVKKNGVDIDERVFDLIFKPVFFYKGYEFKDAITNNTRVRTHKQERALEYYYKNKDKISKRAKQRYLYKKCKKEINDD